VAVSSCNGKHGKGEFMNTARKYFYIGAALFGAVACWGLEGLSQSLVTEVPAGGWPAALEQVQKIKPDRAPYRLTHRCLAYDEEIFIQTPMARIALFLQAAKKEKRQPTAEEVAKAFDPNRLILEARTLHRTIEKASAVELNLLVDGKPIYPQRSELLTTYLKSVGYYADPMYLGTRQFTFDMSDLKGVKELKVVIVESEDKGAEIHEIPVDLARLK
jgi:hypothetical protein